MNKTKKNWKQLDKYSTSSSQNNNKESSDFSPMYTSRLFPFKFFSLFFFLILSFSSIKLRVQRVYLPFVSNFSKIPSYRNREYKSAKKSSENKETSALVFRFCLGFFCTLFFFESLYFSFDLGSVFVSVFSLFTF